MAPRRNPDASINHPRSGLQPAPYASRFVDAGGLRLHYLDYGTAGRPTMLCVHGGAAHAHWFDFVAPGFSAGYHVRAMDLRGHGDSAWAEPPAYTYERYASDLAEVVEKLDLRDFVLIGHSMSGWFLSCTPPPIPGAWGGSSSSTRRCTWPKSASPRCAT